MLALFFDNVPSPSVAVPAAAPPRGPAPPIERYSANKKAFGSDTEGSPGQEAIEGDTSRMKGRRVKTICILIFTGEPGMEKPEDITAHFTYKDWTDEQIEAELERLEELERLRR